MARMLHPDTIFKVIVFSANVLYKGYEVLKPNIPTLFSLAVAARHTAITPALNDKAVSLKENATLIAGVHEEGSLFTNPTYIFLTSTINLRIAVAAYLCHSLYYNVITNKETSTKLMTIFRSTPITLFVLSTAAAIILEKEKSEYYTKIVTSKNSPDTKIEVGINLVRDEVIRNHSTWGLAWIEASAVTISTFINALLAVQKSYDQAVGTANKIYQAQQIFSTGLTSLATTLAGAPGNQPAGSPVRTLADGDPGAFTFIALATAKTTTQLQPTISTLASTTEKVKNGYSITLPMAVGLLSSMVQFLKTNSQENMYIAQENNLTLKARKELREIMAKFGPMEALEKLSEVYNCDASFGNIKPANVDEMLTAIFDRKCEYTGTIDQFSSAKAYGNAALMLIQEFINNNIVKPTYYIPNVLAYIKATFNAFILAEQTKKNGENPPTDKVMIEQQDEQQPNLDRDTAIDVVTALVEMPSTKFVISNQDPTPTANESQDQEDQKPNLDHDVAVELSSFEANSYNLTGITEINNTTSYP